ncbi:GbsR/MarR family transcriptional regulator [Demequina sp. SO4-18]|uniref:GbsR/MarR family transcriptional regulator n=1 Tax=Demequina sp. SO4-18 TaxID=3401026 RepID=UPI003B5B627C
MTDAPMPDGLTPERLAYVEQVANFWQAGGLGHAAGAILGYLTVCEPAAQTQAEIASALGLSAGTVSTQLRTLAGVEMVEKVRRMGVRTHFYQLPQDMWVRLIGSEDRRIAGLRELADAGIAVMPATRHDRIASLEQMVRFFEHEWPLLSKRLEEFLRKEAS